MLPQSITAPKIPTTCPGCGAIFGRYPSSKQRWCSRRCAALAHVVPIEARFWARVQKIGNPKGCWLWLAGRNKWGYAHLARGGHQGGMFRAHRFSYELHFGPIPDGLEVCHKCDVRHCVNPEHFFLGTRQDNTDDMLAKGRNRRGESHPLTTLTEDQVREIRARYAAGGVMQKDLAREYGVCKDTVSSLVRRKLWKHVA